MKLLIIFNLAFLTFSGFSQQPIDVNAIDPNHHIGGYMSHFYDANRKLDFEDITDIHFNKLKEGIPNFGYNTGTDWLKFTLYNSDSLAVNKVIRINKPLLDSITLYYYQDGIIKKYYEGYMVKDYRDFNCCKSNYFALQLPPNTTQTYYLKINSLHSKQLSVYINDYLSLFKYENLITNTIWYYIGTLLTITLYNVFLGFRSKRKVFNLFALSNLGSLLIILALKGFFASSLFQSQLQLRLILQPISIISFSVFSSLLCMEMMNIKKSSGITYYMFLAVICYALFAAFYPIFMNVYGNITDFRHLSGSTFMFAVVAVVSGVIEVRKGNKGALLYLSAWSVGLLGTFLYTLLLYNYMPVNFFTQNLYLLGSILEVLILSFALANRYNHMQMEKLQLEIDLRTKEKDLSLIAANNKVRYNERKIFLSDLKELAKCTPDNLPGVLKSLIFNVVQKLDSEEKFIYKANNLHVINAVLEEKLKERFPKLSQSDIELCGYIKLRMPIKEIAEMKRTTEAAIKMARYRLKNKLELEDEKLDDFILSNF